VLHFFKSEDLKEHPTFLYCTDSDKILNLCPMFEAFLRANERKLDRQMLGFDLFGLDLCHIIGSGDKKAGDTISSALVKQKGRQLNVPLTLKIKELFKAKGSCLALMSVESSEGLQEKTLTETVFSLGNFISRKEASDSSEQRVKMLKDVSKKDNVTFCRIPNPYETIIDEKMSKIKVLCRWSYLKVMLVVMVFILLLFLAFMASLAIYTGQLSTET